MQRTTINYQRFHCQEYCHIMLIWEGVVGVSQNRASWPVATSVCSLYVQCQTQPAPATAVTPEPAVRPKMRPTFMMTSSNGNIFRVTGPVCGEFTGLRWIPRTKASDAELWCFLWSVLKLNGWVNTREAGDLRRYRAHHDVIVMVRDFCILFWCDTNQFC